jgi:beta-glucanase (GH16 family)
MQGDWIWPAIWMLPLREAYGAWPSSGEIDIMESRGNRKLTVDGVNIGVEQTGSTLHYGVDYFTNGWPKVSLPPPPSLYVFRSA